MQPNVSLSFIFVVNGVNDIGRVVGGTRGQHPQEKDMGGDCVLMNDCRMSKACGQMSMRASLMFHSHFSYGINKFTINLISMAL